MDQKKILKENRSGAERNQEAGEWAALFGFIGMSSAYVVMMLLEIFLKKRTGYNLMALFSIFLASSSAGRYKKNGTKVYLAAAGIWILSAGIWFVLYLWKG